MILLGSILGKILHIRASGCFCGKWRVSTSSVIPTSLTTNVPFYSFPSLVSISCVANDKETWALVGVALWSNKVLLGVMPESDNRDAGMEQAWVHSHREPTMFWERQAHKWSHSTGAIGLIGASGGELHWHWRTNRSVRWGRALWSPSRSRKMECCGQIDFLYCCQEPRSSSMQIPGGLRNNGTGVFWSQGSRSCCDAGQVT